MRRELQRKDWMNKKEHDWLHQMRRRMKWKTRRWRKNKTWSSNEKYTQKEETWRLWKKRRRVSRRKCNNNMHCVFSWTWNVVCLRHPLHLLFPIFLHRCLRSCCFVCEKRWCQEEKRRVRSKCRQRDEKVEGKGSKSSLFLNSSFLFYEQKAFFFSFFPDEQWVSLWCVFPSGFTHSLHFLRQTKNVNFREEDSLSFLSWTKYWKRDKEREGIKRKTLVQQQGSQNKTSDPTGHSCPVSFLLLHWLSVLLVLLLVYHCLVSDSRVSWETLRDKRQCSCLSLLVLASIEGFFW